MKMLPTLGSKSKLYKYYLLWMFLEPRFETLNPTLGIQKPIVLLSS